MLVPGLNPVVRGSVQLAFLGLLGEFVMSINTCVMNCPLAVEEKRIIFRQIIDYGAVE